MIKTALLIILTIASYIASRKLGKIWPSPLTTPVFLGTFMMIVILLLSGISYDEYMPAERIITYLLGPATVALAVPLYRNRTYFFTYFRVVALSVTGGALLAAVSAMLLAMIFNYDRMIWASMATKSVTTPIGIEIARMTGGNPPLAAVFIAITGTLVGMIATWVLSKFRVTNSVAWGLAMGTTGHGIATVEAIRKGELEGAMSGIAMAITGVVSSLFIPYLIYFLE